MKDYIINVEGMMCAGCEKRVVNVLSNLKTVKNVTADHKTGTVTITAKDIDENEIKQKIENLGFRVV